MKKGAVLVAIGIGAFLGVVAVCGGLGAGFLWLIHQQLEREFADFSYEPVTGIDYVLHGPQAIELGEPLLFIVEVTNTSETDRRLLYSIDLYTELVDQGVVTFVPTPASYDTEWDDYAEAIFNLPLAPGATERIEVHFTPTLAGSYNVNIDVCIDNAHSFIERFHDLQIHPARRQE